MLLDLVHEKLGWPSPSEVRNPPGEGTRVFADLAQTKIGNAMSQYQDAADAKMGVLLRNPQSIDTEAPLAVVVEFSGKVGDRTLRELHRLAWNFSHSPTVVTIEPDLLRVWTCCEPPDYERPVGDYIVDKVTTGDLSKPDSAAITHRATQALHWVNLVSGQFFRNHPERFNRDRRADQMLLGNLRYVRDKLHEAGLKDDDICHDLLARIVFVQFLFDRKDSKGHAALNPGKLASFYKDGILRKHHADFPSILEDYEETYRVFDWLNTKFNGDLFPGKGNTPEERERGWRKEKAHVKAVHLRLLSEFVKGDLDMPIGQRCLWPQYAFDVIPLEFISSIYETFVSERAAGGGIYYTPPHLVDFILDRVLPWSGDNWNLKILDPACGSGIFLVKAFQRLIHRWKRVHPGQPPRADILRGLLERNLFGVDKDPHAVRVASFSLYLAMCDEIDPKYYWSQVVFPAMREHRLVNADFFEEDRVGFRTQEDASSYDLVIGNAPWGRKTLTEAAAQWAQCHGWRSANNGIGTLFLPKAAALTKLDGRIAMIQSASSLLFNRSGPASAFRRKFFTTFQVKDLVNLSALRFKVFNRKTHSAKTSVAPSCIVTFSPLAANDQERLAYVSPKQVDDLADEFEIIIEPQDIKSVHPVEASENADVWTALMWGHGRDRAFLRQLYSRRTILDPGPGFQVKTREGVIFGDRKKSQPQLVGRRILSDGDFPQEASLYLGTTGLPENEEGFTDSKASTDFGAFATPQLIIKQGWRKPISRFQARIVKDKANKGILCTQSYVTAHVSAAQQRFIEAACLSYNSIFATYFLLLTSSRFASYRPEPLVEELLRVPIPEPRSGLLEGVRTHEDVDQRIRNVFGFKDAEWVLVEDLFNFTLPDFKGDANSPGRQRTRRKERTTAEPQLHRYCDYFIRVLKAGFGHDKQITATIFQETGDPLPYRLVAFELGRESDSPVQVVSLDAPELLNELDRLNRSWLKHRQVRGSSIYHQRVTRIYDHHGDVPAIFILKPDACRYWTRSMGLYDGDEVSADFTRWEEATTPSERNRA